MVEQSDESIGMAELERFVTRPHEFTDAEQAIIVAKLQQSLELGDIAEQFRQRHMALMQAQNCGDDAMRVYEGRDIEEPLMSYSILDLNKNKKPKRSPRASKKHLAA